MNNVNISNQEIKIEEFVNKIKSNDLSAKEWSECDLYVGNNIKALYDYPILQKIYNEQGRKKDLDELLEQMITEGRRIINKYSPTEELSSVELLKQEYLNCSIFYFEVIEPFIEDATSYDYERISRKFGVYNLQLFLDRMEEYFNEKAKIKFKNELNNKEEIKSVLQTQINSIVRFRNGCELNEIAEKLLREGGHIRGTREILSPDMKKRRQMFANSLVGVYDSFETEKDYETRAFSEKIDIDEVVDALYYNRFDNFMKNKTVEEGKNDEFGNDEVVRIAQILKIAKIISRDSKYDYFNEFLLIPDVNNLLMLMELDKSGYLKSCISKNNRVKNKHYPETEAEQGKYREYINGINNENKDKIVLLNEELPKINSRKR